MPTLVATVLADARFALRLLRRSPIFALTLVGILVAGIGATTAMFSIVVGLFVRPLPFPHAEELTMVWENQPHIQHTPVSLPDFKDLEARSQTFASLAVTEPEGFTIAGDGGLARMVTGAAVSGRFFEMLGVTPLLGRLLGPADDTVGAPRVCVLGAQLWRERFGADPAVIGKSLRLESEEWTIVGVAPDGFSFVSPQNAGAALWVPLASGRKDIERLLSPPARGEHFLLAMGRRKPGVTLDAAQAEIAAIVQDLAVQYPDTNGGKTAALVDLREAIVGPARAGVGILFAAVGLVFLVICANVANLLLARAASRRAEMAARAALGASPRRLLLQLVTETATIFVLAALGGALLARVLVGFFGRAVVTAAGTSATDVPVDGAALAFAIGSALVAGLVFGLVPALEAMRSEPHEALKEAGARASVGKRQRALRGVLVVAQVALAFGLLATSGTALRGFSRLVDAPLGYDPENVATFGIWLPAATYDDAKSTRLWTAIAARLSAEPAMQHVAASSSIPLGHSNSNSSYRIEGRPAPPPGTAPILDHRAVLPGYFTTMGVPLLRGRDLAATDVEGARPVIVLSRHAADEMFPGEDPLGRRLELGEEDAKGAPLYREVVGVVGDMVHPEYRRPIVAEGFIPVGQRPTRHIFLVAKTPRAEALLGDIPRILAELDPELAPSNRMTMAARVADGFAAQRLATQLLGAFAAAGLVLATLGIFGLVSYTTNQRTRELGIRLALGAPPRAIVGVVVQEALRLLGAGLLVGLGIALLASPALEAELRSGARYEPAVLGAIVLVLGLAGLTASLLPALRAIRISPAAALRYE